VHPAWYPRRAGRFQELGIYTNAAIASGVTVDEIKEALVQIAVYCGSQSTSAATTSRANPFYAQYARAREGWPRVEIVWTRDHQDRQRSGRKPQQLHLSRFEKNDERPPCPRAGKSQLQHAPDRQVGSENFRYCNKNWHR
jgi:hypothetical protein